MTLLNKYALITGASRGIGKAIAIQLAKDGYHILLNYINNVEAAIETKSEIEKLNVSVELLKFDVSNREQIDTILGEWLERNPDNKIHVLVNNAGIKKDNLMMWLEPQDWGSVIDISLNGFYNVTKKLINHLLYNRSGRIINVVSLSGLKGLPGQVNYSAAKAGVIGATKALAQEIGKRGITVNAVAPGFIKTDMTEGLNEKELKVMIPLNRFGEAEEVANLVSFLASDKASYITGEVININGGLYS
jgi:3-oxoacyl-[acyl-carrier protein] reductase